MHPRCSRHRFRLVHAMIGAKGAERTMAAADRIPARIEIAAYLTEQRWDGYAPEQHAIWRTLFHRQAALVQRRAVPAYLDGLACLAVSADSIPDFRAVNEMLGRRTGWSIVPVTGLVPDDVFFTLLASRRFPATIFIRRENQLDYLQEPDVFHDLFGHVPLLVNPVFADYMQAYGAGGLKALGLGGLDRLARLYWYSVEFGLIATPQGLRLYGAGILSSRAETIYALEDERPHRVGFDLTRIMRTRFRIDDLQQCYFVIDGFDQLFAATRPDFTPLYAALAGLPDIEPTAIENGDRLYEPAAPFAASD
jgi:phenylalanine-4-hydroxylase